MSTLLWPARAGTTSHASTPRGTMRDRQPAGFSLSALFLAFSQSYFDWRARRAEPYVNALLARHSDERLMGLGYTRDDIARIRSTAHNVPSAWM